MLLYLVIPRIALAEWSLYWLWAYVTLWCLLGSVKYAVTLEELWFRAPWVLASCESGWLAKFGAVIRWVSDRCRCMSYPFDLV
jgi:hypothetical protein